MRLPYASALWMLKVMPALPLLVPATPLLSPYQYERDAFTTEDASTVGVCWSGTRCSDWREAPTKTTVE